MGGSAADIRIVSFVGKLASYWFMLHSKSDHRNVYQDEYIASMHTN